MPASAAEEATSWAASLALSRQSFELAVLKSRGFTRGTLLGAQAVQTVVTAILAYPIGLLIGMGLAKLATGANGPAPEGVTFPVELSSAALIAGIVGAVVGSVILILTSIPFVSRTVIEERRAISREERPLIETEVQLGPVRKRIRLTVTNRSCMRFRMILGREALAGDFVVDVGRKYVLAQ